MAASPRKNLADASHAAEIHQAALRTRLDDLFKEHSTYVARLAYRLIGRDVEIDDIVQDVFVLLFRRIDQIRHAEAMRAWLATTTVRLTRRRMRVRRIGLLLGFRGDIEATEIDESSASPEDRAALNAVHRALEGVGLNSRIAWVLRYLEEETVDDVARLCGCSRSTAKRRITRAHEIVKEALRRD